MQVKSIYALARGVQVLQDLQTSQCLPRAALHGRTGIPKASLRRSLKTLMERGLIWLRMLDDAWVPSFSLAEMAGRMHRDHELLEIASPILGALTRPHGSDRTQRRPRLIGGSDFLELTLETGDLKLELRRPGASPGPTPIPMAAPGACRFDIPLQGPAETVFIDI